MITERDEINIRRTAEQKARAEGVAEGMAKGKAEGRAEGRVEGRAEGRDEGRKEGLLEVAKKMLSRGVSISDVVDFTGLSEAEIVALLG